MTTPGRPSDYELGSEFLDAFDAAVDAYTKRQNLTNSPGFYDPTDEIKRQHDEEVHEALTRLVASIRAIK